MSIEQSAFNERGESVATGIIAETPRQLSIIALHLAFCLTLLWFHSEVTPDIYNIILDSNINRSFGEVTIGILLALAPACWIPRRIDRPSQVFAYFLYLAVYLPFCTVGLQSISAPIDSLLLYILVCGSAITGFFILAKVPPRPVVREKISLNLCLWGATVVSIAIIVAAAATIGVDLQPLAFSEVYDLRIQRRDQFAVGGTLLIILGYLLSPLNLVLGPFIIRAGLSRDRVHFLLVGVIVTYAAYQISGQKDALGASFISLVAAFIWNAKDTRKFCLSTWRIVATFLAFSILAPLYDAWEDDPGYLISQLTVSRLFIIPGIVRRQIN